MPDLDTIPVLCDELGITAKHIAKSVIEMDRPDMTEQYQQMARIKPSNLLEGEVPHLIDEWQVATNIWNAVRYLICVWTDKLKVVDFLLNSQFIETIVLLQKLNS